MAIYRFEIRTVSKGKRASAVAAAAYRHGVRMTIAASGTVKDFTERRAGLHHEEITAPEDAPKWVIERYLSAPVAAASERLWNDVEVREGRSTRHQTSQYARSVEVALPCELTLAPNIDLVRAFASTAFAARGMVVDWVVRGTAENPHAQLLMTTRSLGADGFARKNVLWNKVGLLRTWRAEWAEFANSALADAGVDARIDHRSLAEQGIGLEPVNYHLATAAHAEAAGALAREKEAALAARARNEARLMDDPTLILAVVKARKSRVGLQDVVSALRVYIPESSEDQIGALAAAAMSAREQEQFSSGLPRP
jgi:ATP-dependent exoDNAse (exonuclease V) alpha subunit